MESKINRPAEEVLPEKLPPGDFKDWVNDEPLGEHAEALNGSFEDVYDDSKEDDYLPPGETPPGK